MGVYIGRRRERRILFAALLVRSVERLEISYFSLGTVILSLNINKIGLLSISFGQSNFKK